MKDCQSEALGEFLAGSKGAAEVSAFEDHIAVCGNCQRRLEEAAGNDALWNAARRFLLHECADPDVSAEIDRNSFGEDSLWTAEFTSATVLPLLSPSEDPDVAGRIGQYEIAGIIGRGAAGIVLRGFDPALYRNVAIKILDPTFAYVAAARQRFAREARSMASISCENVVPVHEIGEHAGLPYLVMEYVPGGSLEHRLRADGAMDVVSVVRIGMQVAQALAEAHAQGLIHRDIKPGNILLDRGTERARVTDFGLVRVLNEASSTRSGFIAGTPHYMAPEQARGEPCDAQSDLFSLGCVLYALCTGHPPFRAESVYGVLQRIMHDPPRSIRKQNPGIPAWLEAFTLKLLAKEGAARFKSADEVAALLRQELAYLQDPRQAGEPRRLWDRSTRRKNGARNITMAAAFGAVLAAIVGAGTLGDRDAPGGDKTNERLAQAQTDGSNGSAATELVPMWWSDGTNDLRHRIRAAQDRWAAPAAEPPGSDAIAIESVRRRILEIKAELGDGKF